MRRRAQDCCCRSNFDDLPGIEHRNIVANLRRKRQIVQHEDRARATRAHLLQDQFHDLRLNRDIERAGGLIGDQQLRIAGQCNRDHDALLHPARELMRVGAQARTRIRNADLRQQFNRAPGRLALRQTQMALERLTDLLSHREAGVERRRRILKHETDPVPAQRTEPGFRQTDQLRTGELHTAGEFDLGRLQQAHERHRQSGLPGARLAQQAQRAAGLERQADRIKHGIWAAFEGELF